MKKTIISYVLAITIVLLALTIFIFSQAAIMAFVGNLAGIAVALLVLILPGWDVMSIQNAPLHRSWKGSERRELNQTLGERFSEKAIALIKGRPEGYHVSAEGVNWALCSSSIWGQMSHQYIF